MRAGKAFAAEQKIRELKKLLFRTKILDNKLKNRIKPNKPIVKPTNNINDNKSEKYGLTLDEIEAKSLTRNVSRIKYDIYRLKKVKKDADRCSRSEANCDIKVRRELRDRLENYVHKQLRQIKLNKK